jgi:transposase
MEEHHMSAYHTFVGIDISKATFAVAWQEEVEPAGEFANDAAGVAAFLARYAARLPTTFVVLEATGGDEIALLTALVTHGVAVHRADPRAASCFVRSLGTRAKTDALDAQGLARYGAERHAELGCYTLPDAAQEELTALLARRADLVGMRTAEVTRQQHPRYRHLQPSLQAVLQVLHEQITALEQRVASLIQASPVLQAKMAVLTSLKGVGPRTAQTLLAFLPELGTLTRRGVASLAGCAPHPRDSGTRQGYRPTVGGRAAVKRALFLAAMSARTHPPLLRQCYERLRAQGKRPMVALTALMRKLVVILNAKLRDAAQTASW